MENRIYSVDSQCIVFTCSSTGVWEKE